MASKGDVKKIKDAVSGSEDSEDSSIPAVDGREPVLTDLPGIGPSVAAKLEAAGIYDLMALAVMSPATLADVAGVGAGVARKAIQAARDMLQLGFVDGTEYAKKRESISYITTGSKNFNDLL